MIVLLLTASLALAGPRGVVGEAAPPRGLDQAYAARRVALVVGIDTYDDDALGQLRYAAKDAADISEVLLDPGHGAFESVTRLAGRVSHAEFWSAYDAVTGSLQRDDTFLLYVAGHGTLDLSGDGTQLYVMPSEGRLVAPREAGIPLVEIEEAMARLPARRRVMVLDTCYSGGGRSAVSEATQQSIDGLRGPLPEPVAHEVSRFDARVFAAHYHQPAMEDPGLENGVYTHYFVAALQGEGDLDGDGLVEIGEAFGWARDRTLEFTGGVQVPWIETTLVGREVIYLSGDPAQRRQAERAVITGLEGLPVNTALWVDGARRGGGPVEAGPHRVEIAVNDVPVARARVWARSGREIEVGRLVQQRDSWVLLGLAGGWRASTAWLPAWPLEAQGWWLPRDRAGLRAGLGLGVGYGLGPSEGYGGVLPNGHALVRLGLFGGREQQLGATMGLGSLLLVLPEQGPVATPVAAPGLRAQVCLGPAWLGVDVGLLVWGENSAPAGEPPALALTLTPQLSLSLGGRFRPRSSAPF